MASNFFNNTISQVGTMQVGIPVEVRVGNRTVQIKGKLAEGGFGVVELVCDSYSKQDMVLKRCNIDRPESFETARLEINMLQRYKGPYIVNLIDSCIHQKNKTSREAFLLLDYCPGDHLLNRLVQRNGQHLPVDAILRMFGQLCMALKDMHASHPPIIHRDIKLENILFGQDGNVRLCDFGSCAESPILVRNLDERQAAEEKIAKETTQMYRAPEMIDLYLRPMLTEKTDIWALGCVLYAMCFLTHPFADGSSLGILNGKVSFPVDSPYDPSAIHALIMRMLDMDPECRPSLPELIEWVDTLSHANPLPAQNLSEEALQCRANRLAADEIRQTKLASKLAKAKAAAKPVPKKPVAMSANSVAARRLATMRGLPVPELTPHHHQQQPHDEPHSHHSQSQHHHQQQRHQQLEEYGQDEVNAQADDGEFDPFANHTAPASSTAAASSFASFQEEHSRDESSFDPFSGEGSFGEAPSSSMGFDAFTTNAALDSRSNSEGFTSAAAEVDFRNAAVSNDNFDAFGDEPFSSPDPTGAVSSFSPTAPPSFQTPNGFDKFDETADTPVSSGFDSFAPTSAAAPAAKDADGFGVSVATTSFDAFGPDAFAAPSTAEFNAFGDDGFNASAVVEASGADDGFGAVLAATSNDLLDGLDDEVPSVAVATTASVAPVVVSSQKASASATGSVSSTASVFNPFEEDELTSCASDFPPVYPSSWSAPAVSDRSSSAPAVVSTAVAMLDIFGDDLLTPVTAATTPGSGASTITTNFSNSDNFSVKKPRNPLDVLSLYDAAPPSSAPKNAMMGSAPAKPTRPGSSFTPGVSPMNSAGSGMGVGTGRAAVGGSTSIQKPSGQNSGLPLTADSFSLGLPSAPAPPTQQGSGWGSSQPGNRGMGMGMAGRPQQFQALPPGSVGGRQQQQQSSDPFDAINMFKR